MLVVKIELLPGGQEDKAMLIGRMDIGNDGTGSQDKGNYVVNLWGAVQHAFTDELHRIPNSFRLKGHPRLKYSVWHLVLAALKIFDLTQVKDIPDFDKYEKLHRDLELLKLREKVREIQETNK